MHDSKSPATGIIYLTTNLLDGMIYVGQTAKEDHSKYYGSGTHILRAIKKYGLSAFEKEILYECFSEEEMNEQVDYWGMCHDRSARREAFKLVAISTVITILLLTIYIKVS
jgi:hypothetical protein